MNLTPTGVTNVANLALFMVNVSYRLRADVRQHHPDYSILDLKADCRGYKYVQGSKCFRKNLSRLLARSQGREGKEVKRLIHALCVTDAHVSRRPRNPIRATYVTVRPSAAP